MKRCQRCGGSGTLAFPVDDAPYFELVTCGDCDGKESKSENDNDEDDLLVFDVVLE